MANVEGKATAITVLSPVKPGWTLWLRALFFAGTHLTSSLEKLQQLSFIHYARWAILERRWPGGDRRRGERLRYRYLLFESNFNGTWDEYIDAFSEVVPTRMKLIWGSSYGFPGPLPVEPFKAYIRKNEFPIEHYYSAYPQATTTEVVSALEVARAHAALSARAEGLGAEELKRAYEDFLFEVQHHL